MTRQDFEMIAHVIREAPSILHRNGTASDPGTARRFADALAATNPRFDRARFLVACGASGK